MAGRRSRLAIAQEQLEHLDALAECGELGGGERGERFTQGLDASRTSSPERPGSGRRRADPHRSRVVRIGLADREPVPDESVHQPRHRRWLDLLDTRELADPLRAGEDQDRQHGEARGRDAQRLILHAKAPQEVDRSRVKPVRHPAYLSRRGSPP
jgi:hypothetical protein